MILTRRSFVEYMAAFAAGRAFAAPHGMFGGGSPELVFAACSDIHIVHPKAVRNKGTQVFEHALAWYARHGIDAVVVAGDLSDGGIVDELEMIGDAWRKIFPGDKAPDGRHVEKVFVTGNHDFEAWKYAGASGRMVYKSDEEIDRRKLHTRYAESWVSAFGEKYEPIYLKDVRGYKFVGSHWSDGRGSQWGKRLKALVDERGGELKGEKPFFYIQHPHPKGTVFNVSKTVCDDGVTTEILEKFPNAVAMSGHSHWSITDERSIWQGGFTSINLGCLRRAGFCRTKNAPAGYENWRTPGTRGKGKNEAAVAVNDMKAMPQYPAANSSHHGMLFKVYDDRIVIERREFRDDTPVADDWVVPLPVAKSRPFEYKTREAKSVAPQFPAGAVLSVEKATVKTRGGKTVPAVKLTFPAANAAKGARPFDYKIEIAGKDGKSIFRSVLAQGVELGVGSSAAKGSSECTLALETLPAGPLTFRVFPGECFGRLGDPITAKFEC